jgi:hypothetical protein
MSNITYAAMSEAELKQYFLKHRGNQAAFQAYSTFRIHEVRPTLTEQEIQES